MKQNHLAGKSLQLEFSNFCRSLQSNSRELKACSFKKISSITDKTSATVHISHFGLYFPHGGSFLHIQLMEAKQILIPVCKYPGVICVQCRHALDTCWIPLTGMQTPGMNWSACVDYSYWYSDGKKHWFFDFYAYLCSPVWFWLACPKIVHITVTMSSGQSSRSCREKFLPSDPTGTEYV